MICYSTRNNDGIPHRVIIIKLKNEYKTSGIQYMTYLYIYISKGNYYKLKTNAIELYSDFTYISLTFRVVLWVKLWYNKKYMWVSPGFLAQSHLKNTFGIFWVMSVFGFSLGTPFEHTWVYANEVTKGGAPRKPRGGAGYQKVIGGLELSNTPTDLWEGEGYRLSFILLNHRSWALEMVSVWICGKNGVSRREHGNSTLPPSYL